jgi:hypothetical protein
MWEISLVEEYYRFASLDKQFLPTQTYNEVNVLPDKTNEVKKKRMEAFMLVYKNRLNTSTACGYPIG